MENPHIGSYKIHLLVPEDMASCTARILNLNEGYKWLTAGWEGRVRARVWQIQTDHAGFRVYKIRKSSLDFMTVTVVAVEGMLFAEPDNQTRIVGEARTSWYGFTCSFGYVGILFAVIAFVMAIKDSSAAVAVLVGMAVLAAIWGYAFYWIDWRKKELLYILGQAFVIEE